MTQDRDEAQTIFRNKVLEAMDAAAWEIFGASIKTNCAGATDADLPRIFPALDEQLDRLAERYGHTLIGDGYIGSPAHKRDAAFLNHLGINTVQP